MRWVGEISSLFWPMAGPAGVESLRGSLDESKTSYAAQNSDSREPAGGDGLRSSRGLMTFGEPTVIKGELSSSLGLADPMSCGYRLPAQRSAIPRSSVDAPRVPRRQPRSPAY